MEKIDVTIDLFSGRQNPKISLEGKEAELFLEQIRTGGELNDYEIIEPFNLGYRGLIVENADQVNSSFPKRLRLMSSKLLGENMNINADASAAEKFIIDRLNKVENIQLENTFARMLITEIENAKVLNERTDFRKIKSVIESRKINLVDCAGAPAYNPGTWNNDPNIKYWNNCYNYACNDITNTFAQPGRGSGQMFTSDSACDVDAPDLSVKNAAINDNLIDRPWANNQCQGDDGDLVALFIWPDEDYHWYRMDRDGWWSHKLGHTAVTCLDDDGRIIEDPRVANCGNYVFCTFMVVNANIITIA